MFDTKLFRTASYERALQFILCHQADMTSPARGLVCLLLLSLIPLEVLGRPRSRSRTSSVPRFGGSGTSSVGSYGTSSGGSGGSGNDELYDWKWTGKLRNKKKLLKVTMNELA